MEPVITVITTTNNIIENGKADAFNLLVTLLDLQTYPEVEHLIIDNMSSDGTVEMLKDYKNKGYISFYSEKDTGKFEAFNKGVMHAKGKYVTFLSCDDFIHDITSLSEIVSLLEDNNGDFTYAPSYCRHPEGFTFLFVPAIYNVFQVMPCARQAMVFKKSMLEAENYFDEKFKTLSDYDLIIRIMLKKYKGLFYNKNYVTYKLSQNNIENEKRAEEEIKSIYYKNYKNLVPLDEVTLQRMVSLSDFPENLLEKLSQYFPPADKQLFLDRCEEMHQLRINVNNSEEELQTEDEIVPEPEN